MTDEASQQMLDVVAPLWSRERTQKALKLSDGALERAIAQATVLGVDSDDGQWFFPLSQFETSPDGQVRVRPGLEGLLAATAGHSRWAVAMVMNSPADELDAMSPIDWLRDGRPVEAVTEFGYMLAGEWR